jgi:hypothetical protein
VPPATVIGFLVGGAALLLTALQLRAANHQAQETADATELQAFVIFNREIHRPAQLKHFNDAAETLRSVTRGPDGRFRFPVPADLAILGLAGQYDQLAELFLADSSALPHARELFAEPMACALLDFETIRTKSTNIRVPRTSSLPKFVGATRCINQVSVNGFAVGYVTG